MTEQEKQEMAEFLAVNFLGWKEVVSEGHMGGVWAGKAGELTPPHRLAQFFFSPDGFFAVWDKVIKAWHVSVVYEYGAMRWRADIGEHYVVYNADRYEAFYKAVREAWE